MLPRRPRRAVSAALAIAAMLIALPGLVASNAEAQAPGGIISGDPPPPGGFGTFGFGGGSFDQLLTASECPSAMATFFYNEAGGGFVVWIPGSQVGAVNAAIMTLFPGDSVPSGTIFTAGCQPTSIVLGDTVNITGRGAASIGADVSITVPGIYEVSGTMSGGMIQVNTPGGAVELVLAGVEITNDDGPTIYFAAGTHGTVTLRDGTTNTLTDGGTSELDATIYADIPITVRGGGSLTVNANYEGISSTASIHVEGGHIRVLANEDGLNANTDGVSHIEVSGGYLYVHSLTGDGIDSNGTLTFSGGTVITLGSMDDLSGGFDADGALTITGGTLIASGDHLPPPTVGSSRSILTVFGVGQPAGQIVSFQAGGTPLVVFEPPADYRLLFYSSDAIADGVLYDVNVGGTATGELVDGVYQGGTYFGGTLATQITTDSTRY